MRERRLPRHVIGARLSIVFVVFVFGVVGSILLFRSFAASTSHSIEAESGTFFGAVDQVQDRTASAGTAVVFGGSASPVVEGADYFGIAEGGGLIHKSESEITERLDGYVAAGSAWVRFDMAWADVQAGGKGTFEWTKYDTIVRLVRERNLKALVILDWTPNWAKSPTCNDDWCPPASMDDFAIFAKTAAERYKPQGVRHWEVWNEPNIPVFWKPQPDVGAYAEMLKKTYAAIKQADPGAVVISGGLSPGDGSTNNGNITPAEFLRGLYVQGAKDSFDAFGMHPYCYNGTFDCPGTFDESSSWSQLKDTSNSLRSIMDANGDTQKKIWITEFGAPTQGGLGSVTEQLQAKMVNDAYVLWRTYEFSGPLFWYSYKDSCSNSNDKECWFGLVRPDGSRKPAYDTYKSLER